MDSTPVRGFPSYFSWWISSFQLSFFISLQSPVCSLLLDRQHHVDLTSTRPIYGRSRCACEIQKENVRSNLFGCSSRANLKVRIILYLIIEHTLFSDPKVESFHFVVVLSRADGVRALAPILIRRHIKKTETIFE